MDTKTLIQVAEMIDARINMYQEADPNEPFYKGAVAALSSLNEELQEYIDKQVAQMETEQGM
jgi:pyruvate-formate lyase